MPNLPRGAYPSPPHVAFACETHLPTAVPDFFGNPPKTTDRWGNDRYGDCVSAEEASAKAVYSTMSGLTELVIPDDTLIAWARHYGWLNGAYLTEVMDAMIRDGISVNGTVYKDGPYQTVDWTNDAVVSSAIYQGPVKIGVAANQLERAGAGSKQGWIGTGWRKDNNTDHCVNLCGFGTASKLAEILGTSLSGSIDPNGRAYLLWTWGTTGIVDRQSMINVTTEAWLRNPTTPGMTPVPPTPPTPPTPPVPPSPPGAETWWFDSGSKTFSFPADWTAVPQPNRSSDPSTFA